MEQPGLFFTHQFIEKFKESRVFTGGYIAYLPLGTDYHLGGEALHRVVPDLMTVSPFVLATACLSQDGST